MKNGRMKFNSFQLQIYYKKTSVRSWSTGNSCFAKQKKSHVITTNDFQKTNYLKTNLLKQIKKYLLKDSHPLMYLPNDDAKITILYVPAKYFKEKVLLHH